MWSRGNYLLRRINVNKFCLTIGFVICFGLFGCSKDSDDLFSQCSIAEVGSESSSQKDANTAEISFLLLLKDVENSLFALSAHHHEDIAVLPLMTYPVLIFIIADGRETDIYSQFRGFE